MRMFSIVSALALLGSSALAGNPATTTTPKAPSPVSGSLSWGHNLGQGTFVANYYARNASYSQSLSASGRLSLPGGYSLSASQGLSMELTRGGAMRNHELNYGDIGLSLSIPVKTKVLGFGLSAGLAGGLPISKASRFMGKITGLSGRLGASRKLGDKLSLSMGVSLSSSFYGEGQRTRNVQDSRPLTDRDGDEVATTGLLCRADELLTDAAGDVTGCQVAGVNGGVNLSTNVGISYTLSKKLSASLGLALINSFKTYSLPIDEYSSPYASGGMGRSDMSSGSLGLSYRYSKKVNMGFSLSSTQPALFYGVRDSGGEFDGGWLPNFPWWNFRTPGDNYSSMSASVSASF
jgi:hypothetical protein